MMYEEFVKIAGYKVSYEDYDNIIEPMYMSIEVSKYDFVKMIDRKRFEVVEKTERQYINEIKKIAKVILEKCGCCSTFKEENKIDKLIYEMEHKFGFTYVMHKEYEYPEIQRGCTYVKSIRKFYNDTLVKEFEVA